MIRLSRIAAALCAASFLFIAIGTVTPAVAADLDAQQQQILQTAQSELKKANDNLQLALQSAGPGTAQPTGSKAKLAAVRLGSAKGPAANAAALLEKLPADNADVLAFKEQLDAVNAKIAELESRLTGGAAGSPAAPTEGGTKLDYKQEEQLKNARFYVREIEGLNNALQELAGNVRGVQDVTSLDHRVIQQGINTIAKARERAATTHQHLDPLPADGQGVKPVADQLQQLMAGVDSAEQVLGPIHAKLSAAVDPNSYANLAADTERLRELTRMFANPNILVEDPQQAAERMTQAPAALAERERLVTQYAVIVNQQTEDGKRVGDVSRYFTEKYMAFLAAADQRKAALPGEIEADLNEANSLADQAAAEQKPLFFTGGIPQRMEWAETKLVLYKALDPQGAGAMEQKIAATRQNLKARQDALRDAIIASNEMPADTYAGDDRDSLVKIATNALKEQQPDADVLAARIPSQAWKREQLWRNQTGDWYKIDRSRLQVQLIVKHDDKLAVIQPINMWMDHLSSDQITAFPLFEKDEELQPQSFMLRSKVK